MDLVSITPNILDFGLTSENYRPVSVNFTIRNETNDDLQINFGDISSSSMWFTLFDQVIEQQRNLGFDIFYHYEKIDNLKLFAQEEQMLSLVMIPVCCAISFNPSLSIPIMKFKDDELQTDEKFYYPIKVQSTISDVSFKISPQYLFLNECCNFQPQTKSFQIKNTSDRELPIVIYPDESITVDTPEYPNYILLKPKSISTLTLHHIPTEIGQFDHKIIFECLLDQLSDPKVMHVNSSVSPAEVPDDFPTITPQNAEIDFGEVNAGIPVESSFTLTNHSEVTYSVSVNGVLDTFTGSLPSSESLSSAIFIPHASSSQLLFKGTASSKSESKLDITLRSHSALTIYATYVPSFHLSADSTSFEHRTFMITLTFADKSTSNVFYRRIKCKSAVCHPTISISPSLIEFGDTIVGQTDKSAEIIIRNHSPLPTTVSISTSSRSLTVPSIPVEIDGHSTYKYKFKFYPRRVSPDYTASIKFTNNNNISNEVQLSISAIIVANSSESIHSMSYNILSDGQHVSSFDFQNCSINYPSLKSFVIKNRLNTPLKLRFSASTDEIKFYQEDSVYLLNSSSFGNYSNSSIVSVTNQPNEPTSTTLLTPTQTYSLKQLEQSMQINSEFFMNQFILSQKYSDQQIIEHFDTAYQQINKLIENGSLINLENLTIEIPPQFKFEITILLKPRSINGEEPMFWKHREEKIFVHLIDQNQNIEARTIPLKFNVVQSKSFLSTRHLNFGNILCNTRYQNKLYISNESALPFLFELESKNINFDNQSYCIAFPISTYSIPCHFIRNIDGKFTEEVIIKNVLNPEEKHTIIFKGKASRRTNSFIDPLLLDFGDIVACSSSKRLRLFITNTSNEEIEFTLSHVQKETLMCKPLITYQFKYLNSRRLTENVQLQIEKLGCKLRCLQRKNKIEYAQKIQRLIDNLSNTTIDNTSTQLKQMDAKYMDCFTFRCAPLQMVCIELQLIPSILSGKRISISIPLEGAILIYENKRIETQKIVHYKAHLIPNTQRLLDSVVQKSLIVEPTFIEINDIFVHESVRTHIKLKNISNTLQNYWISSDGNNNNCIISSPKSEGSIKTQESLELAIDIFPLNPGKITKIINITTQTSVINITLQIHSEFKPVLSFPSLPENSTIDFGYIPLTSLQVIEERSAFNIFNISNNILYLSILNDHQKEIIVYEKDSRQPQTKEFMLNPHQLIRMNVLLQPEIDLIHYQKYLTTLINGKLLIKAYETLEEAQHSTIQPAIFEKEITVNAAFGRIGISCSEQNIDLGTVSKKLMNAKVFIKNRSTHIPIEIITTCSQGLTCEPTTFTIPGNKVNKEPQEITLHYQPNSIGINEAKLQLNISGYPNYSKTIKLNCFVDPLYLDTDLPKDSKQTDLLNLGQLYVIDNKPIPIKSKIKFTNKTTINVSFEICGKRLNISAGRFQTFQFTFPLQPNFYDPETPKFLYKIYCRSLTTQQILKIINVIGEFVESYFEISTDVINLGSFGKINNWQYENTELIIYNKSNINLDVTIENNSNLLQLPETINNILPNSEYKLKIIPSIKELENVLGRQNINIKLINQNNPNNIKELNVMFDVIDSLLSFDRIIKDDNNNMLIKLCKFKQLLQDDNKFTSNAWFQITNKLLDEYSINITTECLIPEVTGVEIFMRKTEIKIDSLDLQPNETVEVRIKVMAEKSDGWSSSVLARIHFVSDGEEVAKLDVTV